MTKWGLVALTVWGLLHLAFLSWAPQAASAQAGRLDLLDRNQSVVTAFTDGDTISLRVSVAQKVSQPTNVSFTLDTDGYTVAGCAIPSGGDSCQTAPLASLGWRWDRQGQPKPKRIITATSTGVAGLPSVEVQVAPRPVVLVHGLNSNADTWSAYVGPSGYLAPLGLRGYAVGDGQVEGVMNTGSLHTPTARTLTIGANAEILGTYIAKVKKVTQAQQVDLIGHSLGGLISRYYIDRLMQDRDVAQLVTLGSPHQGTDCGNLPASLGFYHPATLQIRPSYIRAIFNRQIAQHRGVPFHVLAGTGIANPLQAMCESVPHDLVVSLDSAFGIEAQRAQVPALHLDLTTSAPVFTEQISPILRQSAADFAAAPPPPPTPASEEELQFTRVFTGHIDSGASVTHVVRLDRAAVASFALFDPTQSLTVTVRGATGNIIQLSPVTHGLLVVDDPTTLVHLGYGFDNPRPGPWQVTLQTTEKTPAQGADYAITAQLRGAALLKARTSSLLPALNEPVAIFAQLELDGQLLPIREAQALIRRPDGGMETLALTESSGAYEASWRPTSAGLYSLDVNVTGEAPDGVPIERVAFLSVEAQPAVETVRTRQIVAALTVGLVLLALVALRRRRRV